MEGCIWCNRGTGGRPGQPPRSAEYNSVPRTGTLASPIASRRRFLLELRCAGLAAFFFAQATPRRSAHRPSMGSEKITSVSTPILQPSAQSKQKSRGGHSSSAAATGFGSLRLYSDSYLFASNQTFFSASRKQSSSVRAAKSACSRSIRSGGDRRMVFSPAPSTSKPL